MSITLTIDEGTTSTRALLIGDDGEIYGIAQQEFTQIFPQAGWVEHDAEEIWTKTLEVCRAVIARSTEGTTKQSTAQSIEIASPPTAPRNDIKITINKQINPRDITNIAITNQRETTVVWNKSTGKPVYNAIVWQCRRTSDYCAKLRQDKGFANYVRKHTGLYIDSYFSGPKLKWILDRHCETLHTETSLRDTKCRSNPHAATQWIASSPLAPRNDENKTRNDKQDLAFGTIDSWLIYKLTGQHLTEPSNAARTMLYDISSGKWSEKILRKLEIPTEILPKVVPSNSNFGTCDLFKDLIGHSIDITGVLGDQQAALYAYHATSHCDTVIASKANPVITSEAITTSLRAQRSNPLAAAWKLLRHAFGIPRNDERNNMSSKVTYGTGTFVLVELPKFQLRDGLVTTIFYDDGTKPHYAVEGSVFTGGAVVQWLRDGLKIIDSSSDIEKLATSVEDHGGVYFVPALAGLGAPYWREDIRGTIFGISRGTQRGHIARATLEAMAFRVRDIFEALGFKPNQINVDGGATANNLLMQFQADLLGTPVQKYSTKEMTALGAAIMAKTTGEGEKINLRKDTCYLPKLKLETRYAEWKGLLEKLLS